MWRNVCLILLTGGLCPGSACPPTSDDRETENQLQPIDWRQLNGDPANSLMITHKLSIGDHNIITVTATDSHGLKGQATRPIRIFPS